MPDIPFLSENLPLFATAVLVLAYVVWSKYFSTEGKPLSPKSTNDILTILLIFVFLIINFLASAALLLYTIQQYLLPFGTETLFLISGFIVILLSFLFLFFISSCNRRQFSNIFNASKMILPAIFAGFLLPLFLAFQISTYYNLFSFATVYLSLLLILFAVGSLFISQQMINRVLKINNKDVPESFTRGGKYFFMFLFILLIASVAVIMTNFAIAPQNGEVKPISYFMTDYYQYRPEAIKMVEVSFSKIIGQNSKRVILKIQNALVPNDKTSNFFELNIETNNSLTKVVGYSDMGRNQIFGNITGVRLIGNLLIVDFNGYFPTQDFDHFVVKSAVIENISGKYEVTPTNNRYYGEEKKNVTISFKINNSLDLPVEHRNLVILYQWIDKKPEDCKLVGYFSVKLNGDVTDCSFRYCDDQDCGTTCKNWSVRLVKSDNLFFSSETHGEEGFLEVDSMLYCKT